MGQREIDISRMCDTTCYVAQPGSGDSVQFLKAGILEVPHILVVNKEDMGAVARARCPRLGAPEPGTRDGQWQVPVLSTSATQGTGIEALADAMAQHHRARCRRSRWLLAARHTRRLDPETAARRNSAALA